MPSPVLPSDFCELKPTASTVACDAIKTLFFTMPDLFCTFMGWMFNEDGTISDAFRRELNIVPAGIVQWFGGLTIPAGNLLCNGGAYKQSDYPYLYLAIGTRFGSGNGIDEFQVPNMGGRVIVGVNATEGFVFAQTGGQEEITLEETQIPSVLVPIEGSGITDEEHIGHFYTSTSADLRYSTTADTVRFGRTVDRGDELQPVATMMPFIVLTPCIKT